MKKLLLCVVAAFAMVFSVSCGGGGNTPAGKAMEATGYIQDGDFKAYFGEVYVKEGDDKAKKELDEMATMFEAKGEELLKEKVGIKSYELVEEKIDEKGETATVKIKITYGNGEVEDQNTKLKKNANGEWKLVIK